MALPNYGVAKGTFHHFEREPIGDYGRYYHGFIYLNVNGVIYKCAVDVDTPSGNFVYMMLGELDPALFTNVLSLDDRYHELTHNAYSGAIDYNRSPFVNNAKGCLAVILVIYNRIFGTNKKVWNTDTGDNILTKLEELVVSSEHLYVLGAPFTDGTPGIHDIHYNQGDPPGSNWYHSNGIWQDGCVIVKKTGEDKLYGYFGMFTNQSINTDDNGNPI